MSESPHADPTNEPDIVVDITPAAELVVSAANHDQIASCLTKVSLFADLPAVYLRRIASLGVEESYPRGAPVFAEGTPGDKLYVILSGSVRISRQVPGMGEEALAILKAGDYFGEMALIDDFPRSADAIAHEKLQAAGADQRERRRLAVRRPRPGLRSAVELRADAFGSSARNQRQDDVLGGEQPLLAAASASSGQELTVTC